MSIRSGRSLSELRTPQKATTNQNDWGEDKNDSVQGETLEQAMDHPIHSYHQATRSNALAKSNSAHCEENNCPSELFKVVLENTWVNVNIADLFTTHLFQHTSGKKGDDWDDSNNTHVSHKTLDFVLKTPESNRE